MRTIRDCTVAVVGGAGFLGSHLVNHLIDDRDCDVVVIDNLCAGRREFIHDRAIFVWHDITDSETHLLDIFQYHGVDYVFNYAAHPYIPDSFKRPIHTADVNFMGALKVINAAASADCKGILQVSSAEIYGEGAVVETTTEENVSFRTHAPGKINENAKVIPHSTYGAAKAAIDALVQVRWREAKTQVIALRQFNCVGERETHPYVIPEIISQIAQCKQLHFEQPEVNLGNNSFRDFQYAGDAVAMAVELLENGQFGEVYNMGSESGIKIYELASLIARIMGFRDASIVVDSARARPWEIWHLQSDNTKLYSVIEARPKVSLEEALTRTIADYAKNGQKWCWEK